MSTLSPIEELREAYRAWHPEAKSSAAVALGLAIARIASCDISVTWDEDDGRHTETTIWRAEHGETGDRIRDLEARVAEVEGHAIFNRGAIEALRSLDLQTLEDRVAQIESCPGVEGGI